MRAKHVLAALATLTLALPARAGWGTFEAAESLFKEKRYVFDEIYETAEPHWQLQNISPAHDPNRSTEFISKYGEFTNQTKAAYVDILKKMEAVGLQRVRISRFSSLAGGQMEIVSFVVFDRGLGPWSEGIVIQRVEGPHPIEVFQSEETICKPLEAPIWHVCHTR